MIIKIFEDEMLYLRRLDYEIDGLAILISYLERVESPREDVLKKYMELSCERELVRAEIIEKYVPEEYRHSKIHYDYLKNEVKVCVSQTC